MMGGTLIRNCKECGVFICGPGTYCDKCQRLKAVEAERDELKTKVSQLKNELMRGLCPVHDLGYEFAECGCDKNLDRDAELWRTVTQAPQTIQECEIVCGKPQHEHRVETPFYEGANGAQFWIGNTDKREKVYGLDAAQGAWRSRILEKELDKE